MEHRQLVRLLFGYGVDNVKGKIEFILVFKVDFLKYAVFALCGFYKL